MPLSKHDGARAAQVKDLGYEPTVVISRADMVCKGCMSDSLGHFPELNDLKAKVSNIG